jgi:hypothetical protein
MWIDGSKIRLEVLSKQKDPWIGIRDSFKLKKKLEPRPKILLKNLEFENSSQYLHQTFGQKHGVLHQNGRYKHCYFKQWNLLEGYIIIALNIICFGLKYIYNEMHKTFLQLELVA